MNRAKASMEPKAQAAARVLRHLGLAIKTSALYPASYPGKARTVEALLTGLRAYMEAYGPFSVRIGKQTLSVDGLPIDGWTYSNLAHFLYTRKLLQVTILPTAGQSQIAAFVSIASKERNQIDAAGGVEHLLQEAGIWDIQVKELVLRVEEEVEILDLSAFFSLLGQGRLSPQERDQVIDILRSGPDQVAKFLQNVHSMAGEALHGITEEGQVQQVYQAIRSLDRIILDEPPDQQQTFYAHLAGAPLLLAEKLRRNVVGALLSGAKEDIAVQIILGQLSSDQLANMILVAAGEGSTADDVTTIIRSLPLERDKAKSVLSILDLRLPRQGESGGSLADAILSQLSFPSEAVEEAPPAVAFDAEKIVIPVEELARYRKEAQNIGEAQAIREAIKTLLDVLGNEGEQRELQDVADTLAGYLNDLFQYGEFALLRESLEVLKAISSTTSQARAETISGLLEGIASGPFLDRILAVLWEGRDTPAAQEIRACVKVLAEQLIGPILRMLDVEHRPRMRDLLCDLLARLGPEHADSLGAFVTDNRWYLVRNIADVLGRMRSPQAVPHLARLVGHADSRVRMEAVNALAGIGTEAAQAQICAFLKDPEPPVRLRALSSLDAYGLRLAMPALLALLEDRDPFNRRFALKQAAIESVARLGIREALPTLKKVAGAPFVLGRRRRELRRLARMASAIIEEPPIARAPEVDGKKP
ncbi:MAG TPA: HEAT repeat domain-containing protein [bacterium]|nr:HEAT repeat domain-containing protein [bacterium]